MTKEQFIENIAKYCQIYAPKYGFKVISPTIGQACLESGYGTSNKALHHNYFGLKYRDKRITVNNGNFIDGSIFLLFRTAIYKFTIIYSYSFITIF